MLVFFSYFFLFRKEASLITSEVSFQLFKSPPKTLINFFVYVIINGMLRRRRNMLGLLLKDCLGTETIYYVGIIFSFVATFIFTKLLKNKLPRDGGREFAVDGKLSAGKPRGAGIIFVLVFAFSWLIFGDFTLENGFYTLIIVASMLTGFFDDASKVPWGEYKKGLLDLVLAVCVAVTFLFFNENSVTLIIASNFTFSVHPIIFGVLAVILVWASVNVTNCSDGVDGLSATLTSITLLTLVFVDIIRNGADGFNYSTLMFVAALAAYLWFNANPSVLMMGDAGSRAMGMLIAIAALKTGSPFIYIPSAVVLVVDGGLGLLKVSVKRFLHVKIFWNIRTPVHDHCRKNKGWSNTQVDFRFAIIQLFVSALVVLVTLFFN